MCVCVCARARACICACESVCAVLLLCLTDFCFYIFSYVARSPVFFVYVVVAVFVFCLFICLFSWRFSAVGGVRVCLLLVVRLLLV